MNASTASLPRGAHVEHTDQRAAISCRSSVVNEEWHHRLYAERDLDALTASTETES